MYTSKIPDMCVTPLSHTQAALGYGTTCSTSAVSFSTSDLRGRTCVRGLRCRTSAVCFGAGGLCCLTCMRETFKLVICLFDVRLFIYGMRVRETFKLVICLF